VEFTLVDIEPRHIELLREPMLALHRYEAAVQPALGHAPARDDQSFWLRYRDWFARAYRAGDGICIAAKAPGGEIIGFVFGVVKEGDLGFDTGDRVGYIEDISVLEAARGAGVGRELVVAIRERFARRGLTSVKLSTVPGNDDARAFYASLGFKPAAQLLIGEV
jgi:ribosomal protein S18 acetylase RimI-like enzyme